MVLGLELETISRQEIAANSCLSYSVLITEKEYLLKCRSRLVSIASRLLVMLLCGQHNTFSFIKFFHIECSFEMMLFKTLIKIICNRI